MAGTDSIFLPPLSQELRRERAVILLDEEENLLPRDGLRHNLLYPTVSSPRAQTRKETGYSRRSEIIGSGR